MPPRSAFDAFERASIARLKEATLRATQRAAEKAKRELRSQMSGAGLSRLGNAIAPGGDAEKSGRVKAQGKNWSASGWLAIRSKSERTRGAIEAYTGGAEIAPPV